MTRFTLLLIISLAISYISDISASEMSCSRFSYFCSTNQDTTDVQKLYNGRAWRNLYPKVIGDQYLFTKDFIPGTVTIDGQLFSKMSVKYDIFNDEILTITNRGIIIQLNKEMIDKFSFTFNNGSYNFRRFDADSVNSLSGYVNILCDGKISLYVKYRKELLLLAVEHKFDMFQEIHRIYVEKDDKIFLISSKRDLLNTLSDNKQQIKSFIRSRKLVVRKKDPWSFIPVIEYCNTLAL
ncbi:MAG: hypothetical protein WAL29_07080 [Bacteroidales bacterium]